MPTQCSKDTTIFRIQQESRIADSLQITYFFYRITIDSAVYYAVEIIAADERDMQILDTHLPHAEKLFEILVNEIVTPCSLRDILRDIEAEEENGRYRENLFKM